MGNHVVFTVFFTCWVTLFTLKYDLMKRSILLSVTKYADGVSVLILGCS